MSTTGLRSQLRKFMVLALLLGCLTILPIKNQALAASQTCEDVCASEFTVCVASCNSNPACNTVCGVNVATCNVCCIAFGVPCT
jgi:hypothetical protein